MLRQKVHMACGMFDRVSPAYGRPKLTTMGPLLRQPVDREGPTTPDTINRAIVLAQLDRKVFSATVALAGRQRTFATTPRLIDRRIRRFVSRPIWVKE